MPQQATQASADYHNVTCAFCSLLCDDLTIRAHNNQLDVAGKICPKAVAGFERPWIEASPLVDGKPASLEQAVQKAAAILKKSQQPLFGGLATDVEGMRAVMAIADKTGGILDHLAGDVMMRNVRAVQSGGWMMTTMGEIRNRADLVVFVGTDVYKEFPRFFERLIWNKETLFGMDPAKDRQIVYLGKGLDTEPGRSPTGREPLHLPCDITELGEVFAALRALHTGQILQAKKVAGIKVSDLQALLERFQAAHYGVMVWDAGKFSFPHADLTVQILCDLVKDLNHTGRFCGFNLAGNEGGMSAQSVCAWQSGYPLKVSFSSGHPEYDPLLHTTARLLESKMVDTLVWIASITAGRSPPATDIPTVVLGEPGMPLPQQADVFIPVGTPGMDHGGRLVRCDNVVSLPLKQVRAKGLPSVATVVNSILQAL
jgi:formylmethanofuran dehydrogenase subunit B